MSKINSIIYAFSILFFVCAGGCASITGSKTQPVSVTAICESVLVNGATCTFVNDGGVSYVQTPGTAMVRKSTADLSVSCVKGKMVSAPAIVKSSSNASIWGNILLGGPIGAAVDAGTGAGFDYPPTVNIVFQPPCEIDGQDLVKPKPVSLTPASAPVQTDAVAKLRELGALYKEGVISKEEFDEKRTILLRGM